MTEITARSGLLTSTMLHVDDTGGERPPGRAHPRLAAVRRVVERADRRAQPRRLPRGRLRPPRLRTQRQARATATTTTGSPTTSRRARPSSTSPTSPWSASRWAAARSRATSPGTAQDRIHSLVFAAAVPPYLGRATTTPRRPARPRSRRPSSSEGAAGRPGRTSSTASASDFFSADGELTVSEHERRGRLRAVRAGRPGGARRLMDAWATTDFRDDLDKITTPDAGDPRRQRRHRAVRGLRPAHPPGASRAPSCTSSRVPLTAATSATPRSSTGRWSTSCAAEDSRTAAVLGTVPGSHPPPRNGGLLGGVGWQHRSKERRRVRAGVLTGSRSGQ